MKKYIFIVITIWTFGCVPEFNPLPKGKEFVIVQSMEYRDKVDLTSFGVVGNQIIYAYSLLSPTNNDEPDTAPAIHAIAKTLEKGALPTIIDIGRWSIYTKDTIQRRKNLQKLIFVIENLRISRPDILFGYNGVVPQRIYEPLVDLKLNEWLSFNEAAKLDFVPHVDAIFPTLFTIYDDPVAWETFARHTLMEAKRFNKPVYAVLCPKFHESNPMLNGYYLPVIYWRLELETCFRYCDGIVIRNYEPKMDWDPQASWWKETQAFMNEINISTNDIEFPY